MERQDALLWWYAQHVAGAYSKAATRICDVLGVRVPPKAQRNGAQGLVERVGRALANPEQRARMRLLCREVEAPVVERARQVPDGILEQWADPRHIDTWPGVEWTLVDAGLEEVFNQVLAGVPEELRQRYADFTAGIVDAATRAEEEWRRRREAGAKAAAEVASGVAALRADAERAREQAMVERRKAQHAAHEVATRVAAAERARAKAERTKAAAERRAADLEALLAERDAQLGEVVADYERRLAELRGLLGERGTPEERERVACVAPLSGRRLLVIGDAPRAVAYRACALSLGAEDVAFAEGMDQAAGAHIAAMVSAADVVVVIAAHVHHGTWELVRRRARRGTAVVLVPVAGMRAFREALAGMGATGEAVGAAAAAAGSR